MEQPIMSKNKIAMTIFEKIVLIDNTVTQMANLNAEAEDFQKKADEAREKETKIKNDNKIILLVTGICLLFSALFFLFERYGSFFFLFAITVTIAILHFSKAENRPRMYTQNAEKFAQMAKERLRGTEILKEKYAKELSAVPEEYWYPKATHFIREAIESGSVLIIPEAIALFEEQEQREKMEAESLAKTIPVYSVEETAAPKPIPSKNGFDWQSFCSAMRSLWETIRSAAIYIWPRFCLVMGAIFRFLGKAVVVIAKVYACIFVFVIAIAVAVLGLSDDN